MNLVTEHGHAESRTHKISSTLSKVNGDGGRGHSNSPFYSVKLCVMINFSLQHNVLCFSFVVVLYSMCSLYAVINPSFSKEGGEGGGGEVGSSRPTKGFPLITFEQNNQETSNFAYCNFNNIHIGRYDQI